MNRRFRNEPRDDSTTVRPEGEAVGRKIELMRLRGLIRKEMRQIVRDPSSIAIAFVLPVILLLLFGYGVSLDVNNIPLAVVVESPSGVTDSFVDSFRSSPYFEPRFFSDIQDARKAMLAGEIDGIVWLRSSFTDAYYTRPGDAIGVFTNGMNANTARIVEGYLQTVWTQWLEIKLSDKSLLTHLPIDVQQRVWFNPELRSTNFLVPGLVAVIMTLIGALLTAMVVAREWERGTMEALMATPINVRIIILGKLIPYFCLGMGGMAISVSMAVWLFQVPLRGSLAVLILASALFLFCSLQMGLLISTIARDQFVAGQIAMLVTFLPAFILSGFVFDLGSTPAVIQWFSSLIAARYYVSIVQTLFLAGNVWGVLVKNMLALLLMGTVFMVLVRLRTKKRLTAGRS